jgi:MFS family permease
LTGLWRDPNFVKLWSAQTISVFGSTITREALPLVAILSLAAGPAQVGLLAAVGGLPALLLALPAGVWVDRLRRRPILISADLGRAVILASVPLAAWFGFLQMAHLYLVALLAGSLTLFFNIADNSFLPVIVNRDKLVEANSKLGLSQSAAEITAPALTGSLVQIISAPLTILIDAISFLLSALLLALINRPEAWPGPAAQPQTLGQELVAGLRLVRDNRMLQPLIVTTGAFTFFGGFIGALYGLYTLRVLGLTPAVLGILVSTGGIGALLGALLAGRCVDRFGQGPTLVASFFVVGINAFLIPLAAILPAPILILTIGQVVGDTALTIYFITAVSLRQAVTPDQLLGRMNATFEFLVTGIGPLGLLLGGFLGQYVGIQASLVVAAGGLLAGWAWLYFSPIPHLGRPAQLDPPDEPSG